MKPDRSMALASGLACLLLLSSCRQDMFNQPKARTYRSGEFFDDGSSARAPVPGTVARGQLRADTMLHSGIGSDGRFIASLPLPLDRGLLLRGRERFEIFCSPCHGRIGDGRGMIVRRGFKEPASFHVDRLRRQPIGYFFDVMTNGFGEMPGYAALVPVHDRWAIAAYLRALQLSQNAPLSVLPAGDREGIERAAEAEPGEGAR